MKRFFEVAAFVCLLSPCSGWSSSVPPKHGEYSSISASSSRRDALRQTIAMSWAVVTASSSSSPSSLPPSFWQVQPAFASDDLQDKKQVGIRNDELAEIIQRDVQENQFMVRADLTRSVYDESATFIDEIDTYQMDAWIRGTKRLFVADKSQVEIVPDTLQVTDQEATFNFTEYLTFNIPLLQPRVYLSGKVVLKRDPKTGLITSYQEKWDQDVNTVLLSAKIGGK